MRKKDPPTTARHVIVEDNRRRKVRDPKHFCFGISETVRSSHDLLDILTEIVSRLQAENQVVVLVGHNVQIDIQKLRRACGWQVPDDIIILDTLHIWRSWMNYPERGNLQQALDYFRVEPQSMEFHNAGNDAWYTVDLLVHKANQVVMSLVRMSRLAGSQPGGPQRFPSAGPATYGTSASPLSSQKTKKKRKRENSRELPMHCSPSSSGYATPDGRVKRRRLGEVNDGPSDIQGTSTSFRDNAAIIDLTYDTPPPPETVRQSQEQIDLTGDSPLRP